MTDLVVVQAIESAWWVYQYACTNVVAIMGETLSLDQSQAMVQLVSATGRIWLLTDGNKTGERCAQDLFFDLGPHRFCTWLKLSEGRPDDYDAADIQGMLEWNVAK